MKLDISLTEAEELALSTIAVDPAEWIENFVRERVRVKVEEIVRAETARRLDAGLPLPGTKEQMVAAAFDEGAQKSAAQVQAEVKAAAETGISAEGSTPTAAHVDQEAMRRRMALLGVSSPEEVSSVRAAGAEEATALLDKQVNGGGLTAEEAARADALRTARAGLSAIDTAAEAIKADVAAESITTIEEIASDPRWP